jgi:uracil-DNA glycosylase
MIAALLDRPPVTLCRGMSKPSAPVLLDRLKEKYPDARYELDWTSPLDLLVATILAAQCTDERVNRVTRSLFRKYRDAGDYASADLAVLEEEVKSTGFYRQKARTIQEACKVLVARFGGRVPETMDEMVTIPGVARKTANVVLNTAFGLPTGVIVDTHVARVSRRMGLTTEEKPERIEADLMRLVPKDRWTFFGPAMVLHGRHTCTARAPACAGCLIEDQCAKELDGEAPASPTAAAKTRAAPEKEAVVPAAKSPAPKARTQSLEIKGSPMYTLPPSWRHVLAEEIEKPYFQELARFVAEERKTSRVFPPEQEVFSALELTPYEDVRVLVLGQDPYHDDNQAHGLCFSVRPGVKPPPSLVNIYKELEADVGVKPPRNGDLVPWAKQGVLLLNAVLTVRAHAPNSHKDKGWEQFTDAVIRKVNEKRERVVFLLWGGYAQKKERLIDTTRHTVLKGVHPSPLSARNGFFGSKPFSTINRALVEAGSEPIDWSLPPG